MGIMRESCGAGGPPNRPLRVGFYDIKETLGKGNFAVVKLAQHRVTNTQLFYSPQDFGFGNFYKEGQALNTWCGSPPYAAPEVFQGQEYEGPPLDVWSLGVVLYVLLCGTFPFDAPNLPTLRQRVLEGRFRIPYFMSQDCESLIRRMLVVDPAKRLTIGQIKQHRWVQTGDYLPPIPDALSPAPPCLQVLSLMQSLGIDRERTLQALRNDSYNHYAAIYFLLVERLQEPRLGALTPPSPGPAAQNPPSCDHVNAWGCIKVGARGCFTPTRVSGSHSHSRVWLPLPLACLAPTPTRVSGSHSHSRVWLPLPLACLAPTPTRVSGSHSHSRVWLPLPLACLAPTPTRVSGSHSRVWLPLACLAPTPTRVSGSHSHSRVWLPLPLACLAPTPTRVSGSHSHSRVWLPLACLAPTPTRVSGSHSHSHSRVWLPLPLACLAPTLTHVSPSQSVGPIMIHVPRSPSGPAGFHRPESCRLPPWVPVPAGPYERCCPAPLSAQSATPVLQAQGSVAQNGLLPITFQEGRRASDTSLTQGAVALRQLRKSIRVRGLFSLSKIRAMNRQRGVRCTHTSHSPPQSGRDPKVFLQDVLQQQRLLQITVSPPSPKLLPQDPSDQCAPLLPYSYSAALGRPLQAGGQILTPCNTDCGVQATPPGTHSCVLLA
eukprot:XP_017945858.1 PREDICTED: serine/threonine-protein kinase SIK1 [Xenopus tropicalis]